MPAGVTLVQTPGGHVPAATQGSAGNGPTSGRAASAAKAASSRPAGPASSAATARSSPPGGLPILADALRFAARCNPARVVVVGGFGFPLVAAELERLRQSRHPADQLSITLLENPRFREGNLVSLLTARNEIDDEFVLMNI